MQSFPRPLKSLAVKNGSSWVLKKKPRNRRDEGAKLLRNRCWSALAFMGWLTRASCVLKDRNTTRTQRLSGQGCQESRSQQAKSVDNQQKSYLKHFPNNRSRQQDVLPDSGIAGCG